MPQTQTTPNLAPIRSYPRFLWHVIRLATDGTWPFYVWMTALTAIALVGGNAWAHQLQQGMVVTHMSDQVSWGLYISNFTYIVGLAAGGVMMVIPAYLYHDKDMHDVVIVGELLAIASIAMALAFVVADLGRPDRFWHLIPGIGKFNWPDSMLSWDVIVLNGYLVLNLHVCGYLIYMRFLGKKANPKWYVPFTILSIVWAISIHTVTAFLYQGLGGRPLWNSALLAPRFLVSAFVSGPAFIVLTLQLLKRLTPLPIPEGPIRTLLKVMKVTMSVNLFMLASEIFTELYTGGSHIASFRYLFFGLHGHYELVPWIWTGVSLNIIAAIVVLTPALSRRMWLLDLALCFALAGVWVEKGMGLIVPAFIPSTLHEMVTYTPSMTEWQVTAGIWALGMLIFTLALKIALPVLWGDLHQREGGRHHAGDAGEATEASE